MRAGLHVDGKVRRTRRGKGLQISLRLLNHQVHVEWKRRGAAVRPHQERTHRQIRDEVAVHDIDVNPIGAGLLTSLDLVPQTQVIGRNNGRGNDHRVHGYLTGGL